MKYCVMTVKCVIVEADDEKDAVALCYDGENSEYETETFAKSFEVPDEIYECDFEKVVEETDQIAETLSAMADETEWHAFGKDYEAK